MFLGLPRDEPAISTVRLPCDRVDDVADQEQRLVRKARIDGCGVRVGDEQHVALVDCLEAANARAVESKSLRKAVDAQLAQRQAEVLPRAGEIDEADVNHFDALSLG